MVASSLMRLPPPLTSHAPAETHTIDGHTFDIRAEVGLLTRNVVVQVC